MSLLKRVLAFAALFFTVSLTTVQTGAAQDANYPDIVQFLVNNISAIKDEAKSGNPYSQFTLGEAYYNGVGVPKDLVEAVKWFRKAAEQGHPLAQLYLGRAYLNGIGVPQDVNTGIQWIRLAANQGYQPAIEELNKNMTTVPEPAPEPAEPPELAPETPPEPATEQTAPAPQPSIVPAVEKKPVSDNRDKIKKDEAAIRKCINDKYGVITPNPYGPKVDTFSKEIKNFKIVNNDGTNATVQFIVEEDTGFYLMNPGESGFPIGIYNRSKSQHQYTVHLKKVYGQWICGQELWNPILQDGGGMYPPDNNQYPSYVPGYNQPYPSYPPYSPF